MFLMNITSIAFLCPQFLLKSRYDEMAYPKEICLWPHKIEVLRSFEEVYVLKQRYTKNAEVWLM